MKKLCKPMLVVCLALILCAFLMPNISQAAEVASGSCGESVTWALDDTGILTVSGSGAMADYASPSASPWYSQRESIKTIIVEDGVTSIGFYAFYYCSSLTNLTIPDSVTSIGDWAFYYCSSLTNLTIPDSVTSIGDAAFYNCISLTNLTIPESVTSIGDFAFYYCDALSDVYYTGTQAQWELISVGDFNDPLLDATLHTDYIVLKLLSQPVNANLPIGETAVFAVEATGSDLTYQWQYRTSATGKWANASATGNKTATLKVPATAGRNGYQYRCKITDGNGNVLYSDAATLKAVTLKITTQPVNRNLPTGKTAVFAVKATGTTLKYQWQYRTSASGKWANAAATGNKTATLNVPVTTGRNGYQYRCQITDTYGNVIYSNAVTLKAVTLKINTQPVNRNLPAGKTATFTVKATGTTLKYQWQYRTSATGKWANASATGNKTANLKVPVTAGRNGYQYRCQVTDSYGNVIYSNTVTLKAVTLKINTQPSSVTLAKGKTATFKVVAKGTGITYQWQYRTSAKGAWKKAAATGNKTATLKVPATATKNGFQYRCVITDKYGNVMYSKVVILNVK